MTATVSTTSTPVMTPVAPTVTAVSTSVPRSASVDSTVTTPVSTTVCVVDSVVSTPATVVSVTLSVMTTVPTVGTVLSPTVPVFTPTVPLERPIVSAVPHYGPSATSQTFATPITVPTTGGSGEASVLETVTRLRQSQTAAMAAQSKAVAVQHLPSVPCFTGEGEFGQDDQFDQWVEKFQKRELFSLAGPQVTSCTS